MGSRQTVAATFGNLTVAVSDSYFMAEPASAMIVSADSLLHTASGGAHDVTRVVGQAYAAARAALLEGKPDGPSRRRENGVGEGRAQLICCHVASNSQRTRCAHPN